MIQSDPLLNAPAPTPGLEPVDGDRRSYDALEDVLDIQRRMIETTREMDWLVKRHRATPLIERPRLRAQLDELTAVLIEYAQQVAELSARYRQGDGLKSATQ